MLQVNLTVYSNQRDKPKNKFTETKKRPGPEEEMAKLQ